MKRALVTGATGFVGSQVVEELLARGEAVRALVRNPARAAAWRQRGIEVIVGDIRDAVAVRRAVHGIDVVHHCAAAVGESFTAQKLRETNLGGLRQLLEQVRVAGVARVVLLSSVNVLGTIDLDPATEELPYRWSHEPAADVKIMAELVALEAASGPGPEIVILRPGFIYGSGDERNSAQTHHGRATGQVRLYRQPGPRDPHR